MAQLHAHPWHTHPDVSPFVPPSMTAKLLAGGMKFAGLSTQTAADTASTVRQPESMQVDSSGAHAGASHASSSAAAASHQSAAAASQRSQAGPSGAATAGTTYDAQMSDVPQRKPARKHSRRPCASSPSTSSTPTSSTRCVLPFLRTDIQQRARPFILRRGGGGGGGDGGDRWRAVVRRPWQRNALRRHPRRRVCVARRASRTSPCEAAEEPRPFHVCGVATSPRPPLAAVAGRCPRAPRWSRPRRRTPHGSDRLPP